jgi:hypothetical protein
VPRSANRSTLNATGCDDPELTQSIWFVKAMQAERLEWGEGYQGVGREAIAAILQGQMRQAVDGHLDGMASLDEADRRNGCYRRHLLTQLGDIELAVPRTRRLAPIKWCTLMRGAPSKSTA